MIELYNSVHPFIVSFTSLLGSSLDISAPGYKYARSICLLTWKGHASRTLSWRYRRVTHSLRDPFFHSAFRISTSYESSLEGHSRVFPVTPLLPQSASYFSLLQPGLRILATCHCPCNDHAVSDSPPWDNISLGHPIIVGTWLTFRNYFCNLFINFGRQRAFRTCVATRWKIYVNAFRMFQTVHSDLI